ncbi:MAG: PAS domain S-box protein [Syntrophobacteraceae bacterium]
MEMGRLPVKVLLIEDDEDDLHLIRELLADVSVQSYAIGWEARYDAGLAALLGGSFDVCLLDYRLGERSGLELLREAAARGCTTPVILLTGYGDYALDLESMQAGAADYLPKEEMATRTLERSIRYAIERMHTNLELEKRVRERTAELQMANEALRASENFTRSTLNALSAHIVILDEAGCILYTNLSWENFGRENGLRGYRFAGVNYLTICDDAEGAGAEEAPAFAAGIREVLFGRRDLFELEYPCHSPETKRWFNMRVTRFQEHRFTRAVVVHADISVRKEAEEALAVQNARLRAVLDSMPAGLTMYEGNPLKLVLVNRRGEELLGRSLPDSIAPDDMAPYFQVYRAGTDQLYPADSMPVIRAMSGESVFINDMEIAKPDGSRIMLGVWGAPVLDSSGAILGAVAIFRDITEHRRAEEALKKSEERFREIAENINEVVWVHAPAEETYISPCFEKVWGIKLENFYRNHASIWETLHPEDKNRVQEAYRSHMRGLAPFDDEFRILRPDGQFRWIRARAFPVREKGRVMRSVGIAEDITAIRKAGELLQFQKDLAFGLASVRDLREAMEYLLETCLKLEHLDTGSIHLVEETGAQRLAFHQGHSEGFIKRISLFEPDSAKARFAARGKPGYWSTPIGVFVTEAQMALEGITALAVIPVKTEGKVVAVLNLASRTAASIPEEIRTTLEAVAAQLGAIIARVTLMDTVRAQGERLQEANAALKALLKRREEDREELEESLLGNVKQLVLPYLEKLKKSRLADDQTQFVEILESHLLEITSPFVHKLSAPLLGLTPAEIRIADLIRQGKSSKEIAGLLCISEWAVVFHRRGLRRKLGLCGKKLNLQTYLGTLR